MYSVHWPFICLYSHISSLHPTVWCHLSSISISGRFPLPSLFLGVLEPFASSWAYSHRIRNNQGCWQAYYLEWTPLFTERRTHYTPSTLQCEVEWGKFLRQNTHTIFIKCQKCNSLWILCWQHANAEGQACKGSSGRLLPKAGKSGPGHGA